MANDCKIWFWYFVQIGSVARDVLPVFSVVPVARTGRTRLVYSGSTLYCFYYIFDVCSFIFIIISNI